MKNKIAVVFFAWALALSQAWGEAFVPAATRFADGSKVTLKIGKHRIDAEVVSTQQSRERGLMGRKHLCRNCGMLFVFDFAAGWRFWMKDTPLPLSIAFIAPDGSIINVEEMQPYTLDSHLAKNNALYALEMNGGWFADKGVGPGSKVQGLNPP